MQTIIINDIKIEIKNENCIYITKGDWVINMDDGIDGEKILSHWIDANLESPYIMIEDTYKSSVIEY